VVVEHSQGVTQAEVMRVLVPLGVAYVKEGDQWQRHVKPRSKELDEWTHYLYDSSGNAVAHDTVVGPPRHLQWVGSPRWSRHHDRMASMSALVASGGKIFYIMDEGSRISIQLPPRWTLICRDAFNGVILWKHPITDWQNHLWPLKSGPTQLTRRLVVTADRVYVTLGLHAPLTELDASTGKVLQTYQGTKTTEEVITRDGIHYLLVNDGDTEVAKYAPGLNLGDQRRVATEFQWNGKPRTVMAVEARSGRILWRHKTPVAPLTLTAQQDRVLFHDGEKVVCLDKTSGQPAWSSVPAPRRSNVTMNFGPKLVLYKDVVLYAGGDRKMQVFELKTGKQLWTAPHAQSGYQSPEDLLVAGGLVWSAPTTQGRQSGTFTGRDPWTGKVVREFSPNVSTYWFHHRCYIAKATDKFLMTSRTGIEFVDHAKKNWDINHWVRGGCLYGIMPCNGMVYAPPHDCACYPEAKLYGMNALAPAAPSRQITERTPEAERLLRGPAFGKNLAQPASPRDWPTFRGNTERSGFTRQEMATDLAQDWQTSLGGRLSSVVIAGDKLFVAQIDAHTVHALDAATGKEILSRTRLPELSNIYASPVGARDRVYLTGRNGKTV
ncbi:MAG: PQQ-binding-like beta-propeller repeat protein, partial [Pirellulaceae bacterium]